MESCDLAHRERLAIFPQCRRQLLAHSGHCAPNLLWCTSPSHRLRAVWQSTVVAPECTPSADMQTLNAENDRALKDLHAGRWRSHLISERVLARDCARLYQWRSISI